MSEKIYIILFLVGVFVTGYLYIRRQLSKITDRINFLYEYQQKFIALGNLGNKSGNLYSAYSFDHEVHRWLTLNAVKAQREIGGFGIGDFIAPFQLYKVKNYEFITQTVGKFTEGGLHNQEIAIVDNILVRAIGYFEEVEKDYQKAVRNPFKWFQYGIRLVMSLPVYLLNWFGIIADNQVTSITSNWIFKVGSGIIALISFVSAVIGIFTGWESFKAIIISYFNL